MADVWATRSKLKLLSRLSVARPFAEQKPNLVHRCPLLFRWPLLTLKSLCQRSRLKLLKTIMFPSSLANCPIRFSQMRKNESDTCIARMCCSMLVHAVTCDHYFILLPWRYTFIVWCSDKMTLWIYTYCITYRVQFLPASFETVVIILRNSYNDYKRFLCRL